jgi:hypothetical protein
LKDDVPVKDGSGKEVGSEQVEGIQKRNVHGVKTALISKGGKKR